MCKKFLEIGKIVGTHGIKGEVRVMPWCDSLDFICGFAYLYICSQKSNSLILEGNYSKLKVKSIRVHSSLVLIKFEGIDTLDQAQKLRSEVLYISREDAPLQEGQYFVQDIIGSTVYNIDTEKNYGKITDVIKTGANDVYQVTSELCKNYFIPVIEEVIIKIDVSIKKVWIRPIKGIFDDAD